MFARTPAPPAHSAQYKAHIASPEWAAIRKRALEAADYSCALCGRGIAELRRANLHLEVHHKHYRNLGNERLADLTVLCAGREGCHSLADARRRASSRAPRDVARRRGRSRGRARRRRRSRGVIRLALLYLAAAGCLGVAGIVLPHL